MKSKHNLVQTKKHLFKDDIQKIGYERGGEGGISSQNCEGKKLSLKGMGWNYDRLKTKGMHFYTTTNIQLHILAEIL